MQSGFANIGSGGTVMGGSSSTSGFSKPSGFKGFGASQNQLNSTDGLLQLAQQQGGSVAAAANELVHPQTSILSTIGDGFKNAFSDFVGLISAPSQIVAGGINSLKTGQDLGTSISDAMKNNISPADVLYGKENPNDNGFQKIGAFLVRTATNIMLDPLTYVTFGAGSGFMGLRATSELTLGENAIAHIAEAGSGAAVKVGEDSVASLSPEGQKAYSWLKGVQAQIQGKTITEVAKTGDTALDFSGEQLTKLLNNTIDSPLNPDFAKQALTKTLEQFPQLTETYLDKGGIKLFGQTVLSGQRMSSLLAMVPGMTMVDNITAPFRKAIQAPFDTSLIKDGGGNWVRLPPEYIDAFQNFKDLSSSWADKNVNEITNIIKANDLSVPESKYLMAAVEAGYQPADARLGNAWKQFFNLSDSQYKMMKDAGIPVEHLGNYAPHMLVKTKFNSLPFKMPPSSSVGAAMHRTLEGPIFDMKPEDLKAMEGQLTSNPKGVEAMLDQHTREGFNIFDKNLATAWVGRSIDNTRGTTARYFMKNIAENFGVPESEGVGKGYVAINSKGIKNASDDFVNRVFGEGGEQMVYHPAIAKHIETFLGSAINDDGMSMIGKNFDKLQNFWKASVTSYFPAFHGRNAISNVLQNFLDMGVHALNPMLAFQAGKLQNDARIAEKLTLASMKPGAGEAEATALAEHLGQKVFTDTTGNEWSLSEMLNTVRDHAIALTKGSEVTSADLAAGPDEIAKKGLLFPESSLLGKAKQLAGAPQRFTQNAIGGTIEDHARLMNFMGNLRNTGDVTLAAKRTKQFLFDYGNLTNFEKTVMKRLLPFYTYTRKNIELQAKALLTTPGRVAAEVTGLQTLGQVISGGQTLSKQEQSALPDWMQSGIGILTQKQGEVVTMLNSLGTPIEQPFSALQPNQLLGSLSPVIRIPFETMSGYSLFQGKMLSDVTNAAAFAKAPDFLKSLIGFTVVNGKKSNGQAYTMYVSLNPKMMNLVLNLPPFSRVFTAVKQIQAQDTAGQDKLMQQFLGVKPYTVDLVQEQQKQQDAMKTQLQQLLTSAGVTAQFQTTYIPKGK